jgi:hypothetical protein
VLRGRKIGLTGRISQGAIDWYESGSSSVTQRYQNTADATTPDARADFQLPIPAKAGSFDALFLHLVSSVRNKEEKCLSVRSGIDRAQNNSSYIH